jgi:integrase
VKTPGRHGDDETTGLYLRVQPNGSKSWNLRVTKNGRRLDPSLGTLADLGLAEARERAREWRREFRKGNDPRQVHGSKSLTFEAAARSYHDLYRPSWAPGHAKRWLASLERDVFPHLPAKPMDELEPADLVAVLAPIWNTKNDTAKRIRQRIAAVFEWAHAAKRLDGPNPMTGIGRLLPVVKAPVKHMPALPWADVPAFYARAAAREAIAARALCFQILTAVRPGEARGARWCEVQGSIWTAQPAPLLD